MVHSTKHVELTDVQWKAIFSIQLFDPSPLSFMVSSSFDLNSLSSMSNVIITNDKGKIQMIDFNIRNSHNEEINKIDLVKNSWSIGKRQKILSVEISPFFENIFFVLTHLSFYIFDKNYEFPLFVSSFAASPNSCAKWSISR